LRRLDRENGRICTGFRRGGLAQRPGDYRTPDGPGADHDTPHTHGKPSASRGTSSRAGGRMRSSEGASQEWSARRYAETAHFVPALGAPVLELLAPSAGERILDLGCGDGVLTEKIAAAGAAVVAVDAAPDMVAAARARGIDARIMPGQYLTFDGEFDAVFSNAALHWMRPPEAVLAGVRRALRPGGRFVGEM